MPEKPARVVVAYLRMSDLKQEDSIERQRTAVRAYAAKQGYAIALEYVDEGIAGDEVEKRPAFLRLLKDAAAGKVKVILADALDRLSRLDIWEAGVVYSPLRKAGVAVETVAQGRIDWDDFAGSIVAALHQQKGTAEARELARRVLNGMLKAAADGGPTGGKPTYGYYRDQAGVLLIDPTKAAAVRLIFKLYAEGMSLGDICRELHRRKIPSPLGGERWRRQTVRKIIDNRRYTGDGCFGVRATGKYHRRNGKGEVDTVAMCDKAKTERRTEAEWQVRPKSHEAIISRDVWEKAQRRRAEKRHDSSCPNREKPFLFSGLCVCSHCGSRLIGRTYGERGRYYMCGQYGSAGKGSCLGYTIAEGRLLDMVLDAVEKLLTSPANVDAFLEQAERLAEEAEASAPKDTARLARRLDTLDKQIQGGMAKLGLLDADMITDMQASIRSWKDERKQVALAMEKVEEAAKARHRLDGLREKVLEVMGDVRKALRSEDTVLMRAVLKELTSSIDLEFKAKKEGKRITYTLTRGTLSLRPQEGLDMSCLLTTASHGCLAVNNTLLRLPLLSKAG